MPATSPRAAAHPPPPVPPTSRINVSPGERVLSALSGGMLTLWGLRRFSLGGLMTSAAGAALLFRGVTGHCPVVEQLGISNGDARGTTKAVEVEQAVTVRASPEEAYRFWQRLENLPTFMQHLSTVVDLGDGRSRWTARVPGGMGSITWEASTTADEPGERLAWQSEPGADIHNAGAVRFEQTPQGDGTVVHVHISYRPPGGDAGALLARFLNPASQQLIKDDIRRFKHVMETGEVPVVEGQPTGKGRAS
jgi:uncharacterized membrane protein